MKKKTDELAKKSLRLLQLESPLPYESARDLIKYTIDKQLIEDRTSTPLARGARNMAPLKTSLSQRCRAT